MKDYSPTVEEMRAVIADLAIASKWARKAMKAAAMGDKDDAREWAEISAGMVRAAYCLLPSGKGEDL